MSHDFGLAGPVAAWAICFCAMRPRSTRARARGLWGQPRGKRKKPHNHRGSKAQPLTYNMEKQHACILSIVQVSADIIRTPEHTHKRPTPRPDPLLTGPRADPDPPHLCARPCSDGFPAQTLGVVGLLRQGPSAERRRPGRSEPLRAQPAGPGPCGKVVWASRRRSSDPEGVGWGGGAGRAARTSAPSTTAP